MLALVPSVPPHSSTHQPSIDIEDGDVVALFPIVQPFLFFFPNFSLCGFR